MSAVSGGKSIAEALADKQKEISIAEFFEKNKHILGFGSQYKALITSIKEAVDNSLDACEEARILPEIYVETTPVSRDEFRIVIEDNGPGILRKQVGNVFGKLLFGSRFHAVRQSRGQQGIGISGVVMYAQLTTAKPAIIWSKVEGDDVAHVFELFLDVKKNKAEIIKEDVQVWEKEHGTRFEAQLKARSMKTKQSVEEYLRATAIVNPHATIIFKNEDGKTLRFDRVTEEMPAECNEIKPHPEGVEMGTLIKMAKESKGRKLNAFLSNEFSSVSPSKATAICEAAGVNGNLNPKRLSREDAKKLIEAFSQVKLRAPDSSCLSPIGPRLIKKGLRNVLGTRAEFYAPPVTRAPQAQNGSPFQVEAGIVYGGGLPAESQVEILRFANRVPLLYQQGADAITRTIEKMDWRIYGLDQRGGKGIPHGPAVILVHVASTSIPYTSEAKEAIAPVPIIQDEIEKALRDTARRLRIHLGKKKKRQKATEKFELIQEILPEIASKSSELLDRPVPDISKTTAKIMNVVWIRDSVKYSKGQHKINITLKNFTLKTKKLKVHIQVPPEGLSLNKFDPEPEEVKPDGKICWKVSIPMAETFEINFDLMGVDKDDYDENDIYIEGIDQTHMIGADPLPGDWNL